MMKMIYRTGFVLSFLLLNLLLMAQAPVKDYATQWKQIEELVKKRLPQSALTEVKNLYQLAKKENQEAQVIKALVYMNRLQQDTRENNLPLSIAETEKELATAIEPVTSLLESLLAGMYWNFYQQNRYQLYNRTATVNYIKDNINTWAPEDFHQRITALYKASLQPATLLRQTTLAPFNAIIEKGNSRNLRPTLYDLLAHTALDYFKNDERHINQPGYAFKLNDPELLAPAGSFARYKITTTDTLANHYNAIRIYQQLLSMHLDDANPDALIDADIDRITFVYLQTNLPLKDSLYRNALRQIISNYSKNSTALQAKYLLAQHYENLAGQYQPLGDTTHRMARITAKALAEAIIKQDAASQAGINAYNLLQNINRQDLQFQVEKVNVPQKPFRVYVNYKNINRLYLKLVIPSARMKEEWNDYNDDDYWKALQSAEVYKSWQQALPQTNDLQHHAVEIKADGLPVGEYILLAATEDNFDPGTTVMAARLFYVSNIGFVQNNKHFFVLHRETGQPLQGATMQVWRQRYNYNTSKTTRVRDQLYTANDNGLVVMQADNKDDHRNFLVEINYKKDYLFMYDWMYDYDYTPYRKNAKQEKASSIYFFTDRSIYRPGQSLYFKGLVTTGSGKNQEVSKGFQTTIYLRNANYQVVDSMKVTSSDYGSFSGTFTIPQSGLTGRFTLAAKNNEGSTSVNVEEYKRPAFYVAFDTLQTTYSVNDTINLTGTATAYAGNMVTGAKVTYRVVREPRFIYPWLSWRIWPPMSAPVEIAHGETQTGENGKFTVRFKAIPDESLNKDLQPVFDYRVYADVTDINGETRSDQQVISVSYQAIQLEVNLPETIHKDSLKNIEVITNNFNGAFVPANVTVTIFPLQHPGRLIRERYWPQPDQYVMSRQEFLQLFPHDPYRDEADVKNWERKEKVFEQTALTRKEKTFPLSMPKLPAGWYSIEVSTVDEKGNLIKSVHDVEVIDASKKINQPVYLWAMPATPKGAPGEKVSVAIGSGADNVFLVREKENLDEAWEKTKDFSFAKLDNNIQQFTYNISEEDRGGFGITHFFIKHNRFFSHSQTIQVPWTNKQLDITYGTFRDKTLPGSKETWTVQVKGANGDKVAAEMLASMYDASLDQFLPHAWNQPALWPLYAKRTNWMAHTNFVAVNAIQKYRQVKYKDFRKTYDRFIFDAFEGGIMVESMLQGRAAGLEEVVVTGYGNAKKMRNTTGSVSNEAANQMMDATDTTQSEQEQPGAPQKNDLAIQVRTNFNETAFFYPDLKTDKDGNISFSFTMPEALTRWKFQAFNHSPSLAMGLSKKEIVTQKELMVQPNMPRFLREGDHLELNPKIVNLSDQEMTGQVELLLFDATTNQPVDGWFQNMFPNQYFTVAAQQSINVKFPIEIPFLFNKALTWRIVARATNTAGQSYSDGEENILPVLTNRILVTETKPLPMDGGGTKNFTFEKLLQSGGSETLKHHALTVEYTSNPAWLAVQALPYIMEYPYECAEQVWNQFYANALAMHITKSAPRIQQIFATWKNLDTAALLSNLQKNQELKSALLEETPWVLQAKSEVQQKKNIALLFDLVKMHKELESTLSKFMTMQYPDGSFSWFKGGMPDRYITQYIITSIGHLQKLGAVPQGYEAKLMRVVDNALPFLDAEMKKQYDYIMAQKNKTGASMPSSIEVHYLYMRSFFPKQIISAKHKEAYTYFMDETKKQWTKQSIYNRGLIALIMHRNGEKLTATSITKSLKETSIVHEELGRYWKELASPGWFWYQSPIESQALMVEVFSEVANDIKTVNELRKWLLKNKQTTHWKSTKATAEAVYALLLQGTEWLAATPAVTIKAGNFVLSDANTKAEAGTGYIKKSIESHQVNAGMGNITVTVQHAGVQQSTAAMPSWGAVYWQYFEDMDKVSFASTPLKLEKKLFIEKNTDRGPVLSPVNEGAILQTGDKIKVRIVLSVDRDMEYVLMKDMRASALEPVNVLSRFKYQDGLGYYESTRDASTNFFFSYLRKGTYVFEYPLFVTHPGTFSNGITTIQSMYAPEFTSHSEGVRIRVE